MKKNKEKAFIRLEELRDLVRQHDEKYYKQASPIISDQAYDLLKKELEELQQIQDPLGLFQDSSDDKKLSTKVVAPQVGDDRLDGFESHRHGIPMLSLDNTYDKQEFFEFDKRLRKIFLQTELPYVVEPKIDGVAISLTYDKGILTLATTRGNGVEGDVVTQNILHVEGLPSDLSEFDIPSFMEIRGEVFMGHDEFSRINREREKKGLSLYANPRNLAAGTVKLLDPKEARKRKLEIVLYGLGACEPPNFFQKQSSFHEALKNWGVPVVEFLNIVSNAEKAWESIMALDQARHQYAYPTDGAVIKLDSFEMQAKAGFTAKSPRWAISYKFESERQETILQNIVFQVGRTGTITPVACLAPIQLAGTLVSRASLHNADEIARKDIRVGDRVVVEKAGEIIPQIISVNLEKRSKDALPFSFPSQCPTCKTELTRLQGEAAWKCPNYRCSDQIKERLEYFASRSCMDIENLGESVIDQLVDRSLILKVSDLYQLTEENLLSLEGFAEKSAGNLLKALEDSKQCEPWRLLCGIGIKHVGSSAAKDLIRIFQSIENLSHASFEDLVAIDGVGEVMAESILSFFSNADNLQEISELKKAGVTTQHLGNSSKQFLSGKTFVLTGTLQNYSRDQASQKIELHGGKVSSSVSKKTSFVIAGPGSGSKRVKAEELGIEILSEDQFSQLFEAFES